ncbi:MAG: hypothetical protein QF878_07545, partial [SAR202 cluster bacterium]|nr:hypothetical protein [SAR202 cluster bacterium]
NKDLTGANLFGADLDRAFVTDEQLAAACNIEDTTTPRKFSMIFEALGRSTTSFRDRLKLRWRFW